MAIPSGLFSLPKPQEIPGISNKQVEILAANSSSGTPYKKNDRIVFMIPAMKNAWLNPQRSFLSFAGSCANKTTTEITDNSLTAFFKDGVPVFDRMTIKSGGVLVEDLRNMNEMAKLMRNFESVSSVKAKEALIGDYRLTNEANDTTTKTALTLARKIKGNDVTGEYFMHQILSGVIGKAQKHYIPIGMFNSTGSPALEVEFYLTNYDAQVLDSITASEEFQIKDVKLQLEIVDLDESIMQRLNQSLAQDSQIAIPFQTYREYRNYLTASPDHDITISENCKNLNKIFTIFRKTDNLTTTNYLKFAGGSDDAANGILEYHFRFGSQYYPLVQSKGGKKALLNALSGMDLLNGSPMISRITNVGGVPYNSATGDFCIVQNFKTSSDDVLNALDTSHTGAPIDLRIKKVADGQTLEVLSFVEMEKTLVIGMHGRVSVY